nr:hypothetical protein [uncultured Rhodopila sp.]
MAVAAPLAARSEVVRAGGAEFSGFRTYWAETRDGCQPMVSFRIANTSAGDIRPMAFRLEVVDRDTMSVFASGSASVASGGIPPGRSKDVAIGGDRDISAHDCLGDMHEMAFSAIHFAVRLAATLGGESAGLELMRDQPMTEDRVPARN